MQIALAVKLGLLCAAELSVPRVSTALEEEDGMSETKSIYVGTLILRVSLGAMFLVHSVYLKAVVFTLAGTAQFFASLGLPAAAAYLVFALEAIGGVLLVLGIRTRIVAAALVPVLIGATWAHWDNGWLFQNAGGGWEYPLFLAVAATAQAFLGAGSLSRNRVRQASLLTPSERAAA
jgi:putative oxidoreductase